MTLEVSIVGAGPAGSTLAIALARQGRSVELVDRPTSRRACPEETLVRGARRILESLGLPEVWSEARGARFERYGTIWNADGLRWRPGSTDEDWQFDRDVLDRALVQAARELGVRVVDSATREAREQVFATGRAPLDGATIQAALPRTLALAARVPAGAAVDQAVIEAVREGWLWWLPLRSGEASLALFADRGEVESRGRDVVWASAMKGSRGPASDHRDVRPSFGAEATSWLRTHPTAWLVGDAANALDPLSSQGLEKALASAVNLSLVLGTVLDEPEHRAELRRHAERWEARLFEAHRRDTLAFYARETRFTDAPFWKVRLAESREAAEWQPLPPCFRRATNLSPAPVWMPKGARLVSESGWRVGESLDAYASLGGVPIGPLLDLVGESTTLDAFLEAARARPEFVTLTGTDLVRRLEWLHHLGFVVPANP